MSFQGECSGCDRKVWSDDSDVYWVDGKCNECAGEGPCNVCNETCYTESGKGCESCGKGNPDDGPPYLCDTFASAHECGRCSTSLCRDCAGNTYECCGFKICSDCVDEHEAESLPCGHAGCNFYDEDNFFNEKKSIKCRACENDQEEKAENAAMLEDNDSVELLLSKAKSKIVRDRLQACLGDIAASSSKKRKLGSEK
jgi:hypothetical protein